MESLQDVDFLLLGCDGIYEKFENEYISKFIYERIGKKDPQEILREFIEHNVAPMDTSRYAGGPTSGKGTDNQTGILIIF